MNFLCSWSGGKDSCFAYCKALEMGYEPRILLNVMNEFGDRSRSHGIPRDILLEQAKMLNVPIHFINSTWKDYEKNFISHLKLLKKRHELTHAIYGDIDIASHRDWEEKVSEKAGLKALLPLWKQNRKQLVIEMIAHNIEAIIVSCNQQLGTQFLGRTIDSTILKEFEALGVDACGENGEYHTLVVNTPSFSSKLRITITDKLTHNNYNFAQLKLD